MLMPLLVVALPSAGIAFALHGWLEWLLLSVAVGTGSLSLCWGYHTHSSIRPFMLLLIAAIWFLLGAVAENHYLSVCGAAFMLAANLLNSRLCRTCKHCCEHHA